MDTNVMTQIRVFSFPIDKYDRCDLDRMSNDALSKVAYGDDDVELIGNLYDFENMVNDEEVLSQDYWIKFVVV